MQFLCLRLKIIIKKICVQQSKSFRKIYTWYTTSWKILHFLLYKARSKIKVSIFKRAKKNFRIIFLTHIEYEKKSCSSIIYFYDFSTQNVIHFPLLKQKKKRARLSESCFISKNNYYIYLYIIHILVAPHRIPYISLLNAVVLLVRRMLNSYPFFLVLKKKEILKCLYIIPLERGSLSIFVKAKCLCNRKEKKNQRP